MTEERLVLADLLEKAGDGDFLRAVAEAVLQLLMESDVEGMIGAGRYERSGERTTERDEALAERAAIAEVLQVINSSPGNIDLYSASDRIELAIPPRRRAELVYHPERG